MSRVIAGHRVRPLLGVVAVGALVATIVAATGAGVSGWWVALGLIAPDLIPLVRFSRPVAPGRMPASMVGLYNATHAFVGPLLLLAVAALIVSPVAGVVAGSWLTHIVSDRAVGYGLRSADGQIRNEPATRAAHAAVSLVVRKY